MTSTDQIFESASAVRHVREPMPSICFRFVSRIYHFPSGAVLLERDGRRDCLLSDIDRVDVPASGSRRVGEAVALDTETTVRVAHEEDARILTEFDEKIVL